MKSIKWVMICISVIILGGTVWWLFGVNRSWTELVIAYMYAGLASILISGLIIIGSSNWLQGYGAEVDHDSYSAFEQRSLIDRFESDKQRTERQKQAHSTAMILFLSGAIVSGLMYLVFELFITP